MLGSGCSAAAATPRISVAKMARRERQVLVVPHPAMTPAMVLAEALWESRWGLV